MRVALIDYGSGNLRSAAKALERAARDNALPLDLSVTDKIADVEAAERIVLPGVGAFADCYAGLAALPGMIDTLNREVHQHKKPFLGICVGMQLMASVGREYGEHKGLDWIGGAVEIMQPADQALKIPHMGWNQLKLLHPHPVLDGIKDGDHAYFVHSYAFTPRNRGDLLAEVEYGGAVTAMLARANMVGTQFHPEKSQATGLRLLANFLRWTP